MIDSQGVLGGGGGIRTHGASRLAGFQDQCFRPLSHPTRSRTLRIGGARPPTESGRSCGGEHIAGSQRAGSASSHRSRSRTDALDTRISRSPMHAHGETFHREHPGRLDDPGYRSRWVRNHAEYSAVRPACSTPGIHRRGGSPRARGIAGARGAHPGRCVRGGGWEPVHSDPGRADGDHRPGPTPAHAIEHRVRDESAPNPHARTFCRAAEKRERERERISSTPTKHRIPFRIRPPCSLS